MGFLNWYSTKKLFKGEPKTLIQLREAQMSKLAEYKDKGTFAFTMEANDK